MAQEFVLTEVAEKPNVEQSVVHHGVGRDREAAAIVPAIGDDEHEGREIQRAALVGRVGPDRTPGRQPV